MGPNQAVDARRWLEHRIKDQEIAGSVSSNLKPHYGQRVT